MSTLSKPAAARPGADFDALVAREAARVDRALEAVTGELVHGVPEHLAEPMRYALGTRGKRLRPLLCVAAYRALRGGDDAPDVVYRLACALEIVHTYSLVHDDLPSMDDDDLRRGRPTVHRVYGVAPAIVAGAALLPAAAVLLDREGIALGLAPAERGRLVAELCGAAGAVGMVGGQLLDLEGEGAELDAAGLERIHRAKTGALLVASLRVGALAARGTAEQLHGLTRYGEALGLAFQIVDDVLDVVQHSHALGKTAGKDEAAGKATYPALFGVDGARALAARRVDEAVASLRAVGIASPALEMSARFVLERES